MSVSQSSIPDSATAAASRLCAECGLCCSGVLFHTVQIQSADSAPRLVALGLKLKRKRGQNHLLQPCPAFRQTSCAIYSERPERCRIFQCRQLREVSAGRSSEPAALEKIHEVHRQVEMIEILLESAGATNPKRPLSKRCEAATAVPLDPSADAALIEERRQLTRAMEELDLLLDRDFRMPRAEVISMRRDGAGEGRL